MLSEDRRGKRRNKQDALRLSDLPSAMDITRADPERSPGDDDVSEPSGDLNSWDIGHAEISAWFQGFATASTTGIQCQSLRNCEGAIHRFADSRDRIEGLRRRFPKNHNKVGGIRPEQQDALYRETEDFFARYYATISRVASLTTRWSVVFGQTPVGSMAAFIKWLEKRYNAYGYFSPIEDARRFRAILEHPEQHQEYEWKTITIGGGPMHVLLYGPASRGGMIPAGAVSRQMEDGLGWQIAAPYENFVFNNTAQALHACMWQIRQYLAGEELTSPIVRGIGFDAEGNEVNPADFDQLNAANSHGKFLSMNGGPSAVPGSAGPPDHGNYHSGVSFGRIKRSPES
jgi:hypothetical protein